MADVLMETCTKQAKDLLRRLRRETDLLAEGARQPCEAFFAEVISKSPPGAFLVAEGRDQEDPHLRFMLLLDWQPFSREEETRLTQITDAHLAVARANKKTAYSSFRIVRLGRGIERDTPDFGETWLRKNDRDYDLILETELPEARGDR